MYPLTRFCLRHPRTTGLIALAITLAAALGVLRIETNAGFRAYVGADHHAVRQLDEFIERFGGGLPVAAVWSCEHSRACESALDRASLSMAYAVATYLERTAGVRSVQSPATSPLLVPSPEGFDVRTLVEEGEPAADLDRLARRALIDPSWRRTLVSPDGLVGAIVLELASSESEVNVRVVQELQAALAPFEARGYEFHLVGDPVEFVVASADLQRDMLTLVPAIVALLAGIIAGLYRSWRVALISLASMGLAVVWAFGAMGWLGWPQTAMSQTLVPFILAVGVCNAIHLFSRYATLGAGRDLLARERREQALLEVVRDVGGACLIASVTTAVGFASFATSGAVSFVHFGLIAALGVLAGLAIAFSLLPILIVRVAPGRIFTPAVSAAWRGALDVIVSGAQRRSNAVIGVTLCLVAASIAGMSLLRIDGTESSLFGEEARVVQWIRFVGEHLRKPETLDAVLELPEGASIGDPGILAELSRLERELTRAAGFSESSSFVKLLAWSNRMIHGDSPDHERPPDSPEETSELLFLLSLSGGGALDRWLSADRRQVRISLESREEGSYKSDARRLDSARRYLDSSLPAGWKAELAGPLVIRFHMVDEVQATQLRSFGSAFGVVFVLVALFFRSFGWTLAAMVPTVLPVVVTLGAMGLWGIYLDIGTAMIAAIVLGVAIDDTVHLLLQYRRRRGAGMEATRAMRESVLHVGRGVVTTSVALASGFFVLTLSSWAGVASFGFLSGLAVVGALLADLIVLPALIAAIARLQARSAFARKLWAT